MIKLIKRWRATRKHEKQLKECRLYGHMMTRCGEMTPHRMVGGAPIATGPAEFGLYACKCGYGECNELNLKPYVRSFEEALQLTEKAKNHV